LELSLTDSSLKTLRRGSGSLKGIPEGEEGMRNEGEGQAIYRENLPPTP
jgi:hypothetical protein